MRRWLRDWSRRLVHGCWFGHGQRIHTRDAHGQAMRECLTCGVRVPVLRSAIVIGPASVPAPVKGAPNVLVHRASKSSKVRSIFR